MSKKKITSESTSSALTNAEINRAATNAPALSTDSFQLGDRTFPVLDLPYDEYITFVTLLSPLIDSFLNGVSSRIGLAEYGLADAASEGISVASLFKYCGKELPEMVRIICSQSDPNITVDDVKSLAKTPFKLAQIVLVQVQRNGIIKDFADFFAQILPLLKGAKKS